MENILKRLGALTGAVAEKQKQAEEEKNRPRRELEEQIAGAQKNFDTFTQLAESGDYASLRGIAFEMYSGALDDKLSVTEGNTPAISKKELNDLSVVLGELDSFERAVSNSGDKGLQKELTEMKEEVAVGMREYAGRIAVRFNKLLENYKTQLEEFSGDPDMIAPVEVHEKSFETMASEAKRNLLIGTFIGSLSDSVRNNDEVVKRELKRNKEGAYILGAEFDKTMEKIKEEFTSSEDQKALVEYATRKMSLKDLIHKVKDLKSKMSVSLAAQIKNFKSLEDTLLETTKPGRKPESSMDVEDIVYARKGDYYRYGSPSSYDRALVVLQHPNSDDVFGWDVSEFSDLNFVVKEDAVAKGFLSAEQETNFKKGSTSDVVHSFGIRDTNLDTYAAINYIKAGVSSEKVSSRSVRSIMEDVITHTQNPADLDNMIKSLPESGGTIKIDSVSQTAALVDKLRIRAADSLKKAQIDVEKIRTRSSADQEIARLSEAELRSKNQQLASVREDLQKSQETSSRIAVEKENISAEHNKLKDRYQRLENDTRIELSVLNRAIEHQRAELTAATEKVAKLEALIMQAARDDVSMLNAKSKYASLVSQLRAILE